jgi:hypothetical protein
MKAHFLVTNITNMKIYKGAILYVKSGSTQAKLRPKLIIITVPKKTHDRSISSYFMCESEVGADDYGPYTEDFLIDNYTFSIKQILEKL